MLYVLHFQYPLLSRNILHDYFPPELFQKSIEDVPSAVVPLTTARAAGNKEEPHQKDASEKNEGYTWNPKEPGENKIVQVYGLNERH